METLLRLEHRYEVRRVARLDEAAPVAASWPADIALVDGVLIRGWLRKDPTPEKPVSAIDRVLGGSATGDRLPRATLAAAGLAVAGVLVWLWLALRSAV